MTRATGPSVQPFSSDIMRGGGRAPRHRQRGVALFVVIVFVLLSMLLALWASRTSMFNELVVGNDADYQRAFEAAQALLQDAELDVRGEKANGTACVPDASSPDVCRNATLDKIPLAQEEVGATLAALETLPTRCRNGLCVKRIGRQDFWNYTSGTTPSPAADAARGEVPLEQLRTTGIGARYGRYTGAVAGDQNSPANAILGDQGADNRGGWYWIEVLPYDESSKSANLVTGGNTNLLPLNLTPSVVYRITALAYGRKTSTKVNAGLGNFEPATMVVLQETYAPTRLKD